MKGIYEDVLEWEVFESEEITQKNESIKLLDDLNPRYFEEVIMLKDVKTMIFSQSSNNESIYNIFSVY